MRLTNGFANWVLSACESDAVVHAQFSKVTGLIDPPIRLFNPSFVYRVATVNRRRQRQLQPQRAGVAGQ
jgi:hypothetical protein